MCFIFSGGGGGGGGGAGVQRVYIYVCVCVGGGGGGLSLKYAKNAGLNFNNWTCCVQDRKILHVPDQFMVSIHVP